MKMRLGRLQALLLGAVLAIGAGLAWGLAVGILGMTIEGLFPRQVIEPGRHKQLHVLRDGTPVVYSGKEDQDGDIYHTLDDERVKETNQLDGSLLGVPGCSYVDSTLTWNQRVIKLGGSLEWPNLWYFIHDGAAEGHGYFVGYNNETNLKIGCIGRNGFQSDIPPVEEQFSVDASQIIHSSAILDSHNHNIQLYKPDRHILFLLADHELLEVSLKNQTVKPLWKGNGPFTATIEVKIETTQGNESNQTIHLESILIRTPEKVIILDFDGKVLATYILPQELRRNIIEFMRLPNGEALIRRSGIDNELFWIDTEGKIVRHECMDLFHKDTITHYPWPYQIAKNAMAFFSVPSPGGIVGALISEPWDFWNTPWRTRALDYSAALWQALHDVRLLLLVNGVLAAIMAFFCYRRQRKYGLPWTGVWTGFVLLFGLPAYFGYLAHRRWPARLACPDCGKCVPRDRLACFACGQEFPPAARKGIEVFA